MSSPIPERESPSLTKEQFDRLLQWLDSDREKAGTRYEVIRKRLLKVFACFGEQSPEELVDLTINRVARRVEEIQPGYVGDPVHYFCGVATKIVQEVRRKRRIPAVLFPLPVPVDEVKEENHRHLEECIGTLSLDDRRFVLAYYDRNKGQKIELRKRLAEELGVTTNALRIRAHRIRAGLRECFERRRGASRG